MYKALHLLLIMIDLDVITSFLQDLLPEEDIRLLEL